MNKWAQVIFRYAGGAWQTYGEIADNANLAARLEAARESHPTAMVGAIESSSRDEVVYMRNRLLAESQGKHDDGVPPYEAGAGGDKDTPYTGPVLPHAWPVVSAWVRMMGQVQRGELGGENDGAIRLGPAQEEGAA